MKKPIKENPLLLSKLVRIFDWLSVFSSLITLVIIIIKSLHVLEEISINIISIISGSITFLIVIIRTVFNQYKTKLTLITSSPRTFNNYSINRKKITEEVEKIGSSYKHHFETYTFRVVCQNCAGDEESENFCLELLDILISSGINVKHLHSIDNTPKSNKIKIYLNDSAEETGKKISLFFVELFDRINLNSQIVLSKEISQDEVLVDIGIRK